MENKLMKQSIRRLDVEDKILDMLENNNINTLGILCGKTKSDLKKIDLIQNQINSLLFEMFNFSSMSNLGKIIAHLEYMNGLYFKIFNCNQELNLKLD